MKKLIKILPIIMTAMLVFTATTTVFAGTTIGGITINPSAPDNASNQIGKVGNGILGVIQIVGSLVAVGVIMVLGIKYMMGSAEEKAEYKKTFIPYIVGAVLLFAGVNIASAVVSMVENL